MTDEPTLRGMLARMAADGAAPEVVSGRMQAWVASLPPHVRLALPYRWRFWAREEQVEPVGDYSGILVLAGRGWGKTRMGAEWVRERVAAGERRVGFIGQTAGDVREVMIEGPSGIMAVTPRVDRPLYEPSKRRLTWPGGCIGSTYSGDSPDQLRGPQHGTVWADEPAKYAYPEACWSNMEMGLRMGAQPRWLATTTPRPTPLILALVKDPHVQVIRGATYDNAANLPPAYLERVRRRYEGTRLGRQELYAEILEDVQGALWSRQLIERYRVQECPDLWRTVVGVDPQGHRTEAVGEDGERAPHETGIMVAGLAGEDGYVLEDLSGNLSPMEWGRRVVEAYHRHSAAAVVAEANFGGDMVEHVIRQADPRVHVEMVTASRGKALRAEPVVGLYEQGRIHHVGVLADLESEQCTWVPDEPGQPSPNRMDALVWAVWRLMLQEPAQYSEWDPGRHVVQIGRR